MEEKVNIAEILKDKPQGTKLYDLLRNIDVKLDEVHITDVGTYIECTSTNEVGSTFLFDYSKLGTEESWLDGLQILLPSKEMRDWSKLAWNTGDILVNKDGNAHVIFGGGLMMIPTKLSMVIIICGKMRVLQCASESMKTNCQHQISAKQTKKTLRNTSAK